MEDDARGDLDLERRRNCQISTPAMSNASPTPAITSRIVGRVITCDPAGLARPSVSFHYFSGWQEIVWSQVKSHVMKGNVSSHFAHDGRLEAFQQYGNYEVLNVKIPGPSTSLVDAMRFSALVYHTRG